MDKLTKVPYCNIVVSRLKADQQQGGYSRLHGDERHLQLPLACLPAINSKAMAGTIVDPGPG